MTTMNIDTIGGGMVVRDDQIAPNDRLTAEALNEYAAALVADAEFRDGHPWVQSPSARTLRAVRAVWDVLRPGWTNGSSTDESLAALIAHYAIAHHLGLIGAIVLDPVRAAARRALMRRPEIAVRVVRGFRGLDGVHNEYTVGDLLSVPGSHLAIPDGEPINAARDASGLERTGSARYWAETVEAYVLREAALPQ